MNILFILFLPTSGWWPFARGPLGLTMWPLAASGGWPLARGQLHSDLVNARRMRPAYMPGAVGEGGPYKRGTNQKQLTAYARRGSRDVMHACRQHVYPAKECELIHTHSMFVVTEKTRFTIQIQVT